MRKLIIAAAALATLAPVTAASAQWGHPGQRYGHYDRDYARELRECRRELRRADSRREYRQELRECRRELRRAQRDGYHDRYRYRRGDGYRGGYRW